MSPPGTVRPLQLGVFVAEQLHAGGGYQQSLNATLLAARVRLPDWSVIAFTPHAQTRDLLHGLGLEAVQVPIGAVAAAMLAWRRRIRWPGLLRRVRRGFGANPFERVFEQRGIDLVYFTSPSDRALDLERTNYLLTVWDLCHRDELEFPEVHADREFDKREHYYRDVLPGAVAVFADSTLGAQNLVRRYALDPERVNVMRSSPSMHTRLPPQDPAARDPRQAYGFEGDYVFYPAQFWAHKNHVYLLQALHLLAQQHGVRLHAVFAGGDAGGTQGHVRALAHSLGLQDRIHFAGFVPDQDMPQLYRQALAMVMPTYFGPTNLPPLEALHLGTPVVYPRPLAVASGLQDVVRCIELDNPQSLVDVLLSLVRDKAAGVPLLDAHAARAVLAKLDDDEARLAVLESVLAGFARRRACWP